MDCMISNRNVELLNSNKTPLCMENVEIQKIQKQNKLLFSLKTFVFGNKIKTQQTKDCGGSLLEYTPQYLESQQIKREKSYSWRHASKWIQTTSFPQSEVIDMCRPDVLYVYTYVYIYVSFLCDFCNFSTYYHYNFRGQKHSQNLNFEITHHWELRSKGATKTP